jgi:anti-anti-sigma factor
MALAMTSRSVSHAVVLDLTGKLCVREHTLREKIKALLDEGRRCFVLNLAAVTYIDSDGLGELISIWTSISKANGRLTLLHPVQRVQELFRITKLNTVFEIFDDESQAVGVAQHGVRQV